MPKFVPRQRKHKVLARQKSASGRRHETEAAPHEDANAIEILPASKIQKEQRRAKLQEELLAQQPKVSSKKRKRLDHYIDTKLRKEENLELIKKLATTRVDTSLYHSSRKLGSGGESKRAALSRAYRENAVGINVENNESILLQPQRPTQDGERDIAHSDDDSDASSLQCVPEAEGVMNGVGPVAASQSEPTKATSAFGSGLKRPLGLDADGRPVIRKRQRVVPSVLEKDSSHLSSRKQKDTSSSDEADWDGFSDDASEASSHAVGEGDPSGSESEGEDESDDNDVDHSKISTFKAWAVKQRNEAIGFTPSTAIQELPSQHMAYQPRPPELEPLPPELQAPDHELRPRQVHSVHVERTPVIQEARSALPVVAEEQKIMEAVHNNDTIIICGATGSGKTTQVPQFLFEGGYGDPNGPTPGIIGVTQPRRVAAVSMAERVGDELGQHKKRVGYQIRFDHSTVNKNTAIKFMTDGILLREITQDVSLSKYSAIIIDEAHERSVNTDILIGMLSRIVYNIRAENAQRDGSMKPLKLIIMSATMKISDFLSNSLLFPRGVPPLVEAEGRQYPVTVHFSRQTQRDYVEDAFQKVCRGHRKLPPGAILVFLTGQNEIVTLEKRLKEALGGGQDRRTITSSGITASEAPLEAEDMVIGQQKGLEDDASDDEVDITGLDEDDQDAEEKEFDIGQTDDEQRQTVNLGVHVLPLYSQLPTKEQLRVFQPTPEGSRLIVLATNVAETSLTIPGIRYVFDCGRAKEKKYDLRSGVQSFEIDWISKASASQRTGRAGRTGPGHCYRLYSSALYEAHFPEHTQPEISRTPMEDVVLQLKSMGLPNAVNFPFPTPPERQNLEKAEKLLKCLGALDRDGKVTALGRKLSSFPLSPRFSRMLVAGQERSCMPLVITLVSALSVPEVFIPQSQVDHPHDDINGLDGFAHGEQEARRKAYNAAHASFSNLDPSADAVKLFTALSAYSWEAQANHSNSVALDDFCHSYFLRAKAMKEAMQLRQQLSAIAERNKAGSIGAFSQKVPTPSDAEVHLLRTITAAGFLDQVAIRADLAPQPPEMGKKPSKTIDVPYKPLFASNTQGSIADDLVYLHPTSVLAHRSKAKLPQYIVYSSLQRSSAGKVRMHPLTPVSGAQLAMLAKDTPLLELGKPLGKVEMQSQDIRVCDCVASLVGERGSTPWPLRTWRVKQRRSPGKGWVLDEILS